MVRLAGWTQEQLIFLDESAANERVVDRKHGWSTVGTPAIRYASVKRSAKWCILPAYTIDGFLDYSMVHGSYNTALFIEFVEQKVLPHCTPFPGPRSVIVMDNAVIYRSLVFTTFVVANKADSQGPDSCTWR